MVCEPQLPNESKKIRDYIEQNGNTRVWLAYTTEDTHNTNNANSNKLDTHNHRWSLVAFPTQGFTKVAEYLKNFIHVPRLEQRLTAIQVS